MLPLLALPISVKYEDLEGLQKIAWDVKMQNDPTFFKDIVNMQTLERKLTDLYSRLNYEDSQMLQKLLQSKEKLVEHLKRTSELEKEVETLSSNIPTQVKEVNDLTNQLMQMGSELSNKESENTLHFVRSNEYEIITTWIRAQRVAMCTKLASKVFLKATVSGELIPMEFDIELDMFGINVNNNKDFKRVDVGLENQCYSAETNHVDGLKDCIDSENTWDVFADAVRVVYMYNNDRTETLFATSSPMTALLPRGGAYLEYQEDEYGNQVGIGKELTVNPEGIPEDIYVPESGQHRLRMWHDWKNMLFKKYAYEESQKHDGHPILTPVYWVTLGEPKKMRIEDEYETETPWTNMGLGYYAIPIDLLARLVTKFETELEKEVGPGRPRC
jgi:hypothetical protein